MTIIHITYAFGLGGIETMLRNIANEQARFGYNIHLIVINNNVNDELRTSLNEKIKFYYKPQNKMFHFCKTFCSKITLVNTIQNVI